MPKQKLNFRDFLGGLVFVLVVIGTYVLWQNLRTVTEDGARKYFKEIAHTQRDLLINRMKDYEQVLLGAAGLFAASDQVSRKDWREYVDALHLDMTLPGIQGVGFTEMVQSRDKATHEAKIRQEGYPAYSISPAGERDLYSSIVYLEPFSGRNVRAFGYDMYSEPIRRLAMQRAAANAEPAWTSKVTLVQEDGDGETQPGFLVYVPIYAKNKMLRTVEERQSALIGFVYSPFRAWDMLGKLYQDSNRPFELQLYAGGVQAENLLYETAPADSGVPFRIDLPVAIGGTEWTARFWSSPNLNLSLEARLNDQLIRYLALVGMECLLFMTFVIDSRYRRREEFAKRELESANREIKLIANLMQQLQNCNEENQVYPIAQRILRDLFPNTSGSCYTLSDDGKQFSRVATWGAAQHIPETFSAQTCLSCQNHQANWVDSHNKTEAVCGHVSDLNVGYICMPLLVRNQVIGSIYLEPFSAEGLSESIFRHYSELLVSVADSLSLSISNLRLRHSLHDLSIRDPLTGLHNRRYMEEGLTREIERARRTGTKVAVVILDVDHFKKLNDHYGHEAGDVVLKRVAETMKDFRVGSDIVCRYGGEEFVLILPDMSPEMLSRRIESLRKNIEAIVINVGDQQLPVVTVSIGVARYPSDSSESTQLLHMADFAMYRAKQNGRNRIEWASSID